MSKLQSILVVFNRSWDEDDGRNDRILLLFIPLNELLHVLWLARWVGHHHYNQAPCCLLCQCHHETHSGILLFTKTSSQLKSHVSLWQSKFSSTPQISPQFISYIPLFPRFEPDDLCLNQGSCNTHKEVTIWFNASSMLAQRRRRSSNIASVEAKRVYLEFLAGLWGYYGNQTFNDGSRAPKYS